MDSADADDSVNIEVEIIAVSCHHALSAFLRQR